MTLKYHIVSSFHFIAISGWSVVKAVTTLIHNMEKVLNGKCIFMLLAFDIKGVFDRVTEKQLI